METVVDEELLANGIAVVGMAGRFPGAETLDEFWQNLCAGHESITRFSRDELIAAGVDSKLVDHADYVPMGRILRDIESFDAGFFGFTPREAELLDPQQRLFLECAHEALEVAGYGASAHRGTVGVFAGVTTSSYLLNHLLPNSEIVRKQGQFQLFLQNEKDFLPTRLAYKLDLRGPAVNVQTACSTSLVAVHMACQALLEDACDMALAGGASIQVPQRAGYLYQKDMIFSPDGRSYAFDARAKGTIVGSGVGAVVLKRLEKAIADRDPILAVIRGSAINNDGASKIGFTAPSVEGQARVIREALAVAGVSADTISHVEAHGTGTPLGDPIEVAALSRVFRTDTQRKGFCALGALKNNVGHMDAAAGIAGLIKTVLLLKHGKIPPSPTFEAPNPQIDLANSPFYVPLRLLDLGKDDEPRRASVSSFGIGGTNAHVIVEEAPSIAPSEATDGPQLLTLSGKTPSALQATCQKLAKFLDSSTTENLADVAYTLHIGREAHAFRRAVVCRNAQQAVKTLMRPMTEPTTQARSVVFQFPGGGAQYRGMARGLYETYPTFRKYFDRCAAIVQSLVKLEITQLLFDPTNESAARQEKPLLGFSCLFAVEYALASLLITWGIQPEILMGHSMGEYVAACFAGIFSLEDALLLVTKRGALFESLPERGGMISVPRPENDVLPLLGGNLAIAAVNTPLACTVSGPTVDIEKLAVDLEARGISCKRIHLDVAAHSPVLDPILDPFRKVVRTIRLSPPRIPILSNRTGTWMTDAEATNPEYWVEQLRYTVRYTENVERVFDEPSRVLLEVGPGRTLSSLTRQNPRHRGQAIVSTMRHPLTEQPDVDVLLGAIGALWSHGIDLDWSAFHAHEERRRLALPTYPFERQRFWIDPPTKKQAPTAKPARNVMTDVADWFYGPSFRQAILSAHEERALQRIVLLLEESPLCSRILAALRARGHEVVLVRPVNGFSWTSHTELSLDPREPAHYDALCRSLKEKMGSSYAPNLVVHGFTAAHASSRSTEDALAAGFYSLLFLTQALDGQGWLPKTRLCALTSGLFSISGEEYIQPAHATLLGWLKTAPLEIPGLSCKIVETHPPVAAEAFGAHVEAIVTELLVQTDETLVAYRGKGRWTLGYERTRIPEATREKLPIRAGGVYLITGGLGGVGLSIAAAIAARAPVKLVLLGRTPLDTNDATEATREKLRRVEELKKLGSEVLTLAVDVADREAMRAGLSEAKARFGEIQGVVHAAGVAGGGVILRQTPEALGKTLAPKVQGTVVLSELLANEPLEFVVLCSALSTAVGAFGSCDYTAANAFLDTFAQAASMRGLPRVISIGWYRWKHLGMAKAVEARHEELTGEAAPGMAEEQGQDAFLRILGLLPRGCAHVLVCPENLENLLQKPVDAPALRAMAHAAREARTDTSTRRSSVVWESPTQERIAVIFRELLGIEHIEAHDDFFALGGDSLVGTRLVAHVREAFGQQLALRDLFAAPTVAGLARRLDTVSLLHEMEGSAAASSEAVGELEVGAL